MSNNEWWRGGVFYQIYPRSFMDSNKDGIGDLPGITARLDYVADLGVDAIWISPFFKSPMRDYGYDVSDYTDVDPLFGTRDDFRKLLDKAHKRGLKVIVDIVLSHTSEEHAWFKESCSSRDNPKADWYVWADPKPDGTPPNNWLSIFGGSAWQFNVFRGQYYLHNFLKEQPDLNYNNPAVVQAMLDQCRYWLDFGVDGFRLDVLNFCTHDAQLRDNPPRDDGGLASQLEFPDAYAMQWHKYDKSQPQNIEVARKLRKLLDEYPGTTALAEIGDDNSVKLAAEYTATPQELHMAYSFALMVNKGKMPAASLFRNVLNEQAAEPGHSWPAWALSNHDVTRAVSRWSGSEYGRDQRLAKMLMALLLSLRGTPFIYQGDELGLPEADLAYEDILDPWGKYLYPKWKGRDGCRTPMPWENKPQGGFTKAKKSWLPVDPAHPILSVKMQEKDKESVLHYTREFLKQRRDDPAMIKGDITFKETKHDYILAFDRTWQNHKTSCLFNLSDQAQAYEGQTLPPYGVVIQR